MRTKHLLACALLLTQLSCAKKTPEIKEAPNGVDLRVQLEEPGAEPREKLRYKRVNGLTENLVIKLGLGMLLATTDSAASVEAPVLALRLTVGTVSCTDGEDSLCSYPFRFRVIGVKMPAGASEEQTSQAVNAVAPLAAVSGMFEADLRGMTRRADVVVPEGISPRLLTLLGNIRTSLISVPLPEEAVGVGARWKVERVHHVGKIASTQTVVYTLLEREDRILRLGVTLRQSAKPQEVAFVRGTTLKVESYETSGSGSMAMNLDGVTPTGQLRATSELRGEIKNGTEREPLALVGEVQAVVAPLPADAQD